MGFIAKNFRSINGMKSQAILHSTHPPCNISSNRLVDIPTRSLNGDTTSVVVVGASEFDDDINVAASQLALSVLVEPFLLSNVMTIFLGSIDFSSAILCKLTIVMAQE